MGWLSNLQQMSIYAADCAAKIKAAIISLDKTSYKLKVLELCLVVFDATLPRICFHISSITPRPFHIAPWTLTHSHCPIRIDTLSHRDPIAVPCHTALTLSPLWSHCPFHSAPSRTPLSISLFHVRPFTLLLSDLRIEL
jgi:hypothetical protein